MAHSKDTADSAVGNLLLLCMNLQWVNLEEVAHLRRKINLLPKSVLGCFFGFVSLLVF